MKTKEKQKCFIVSSRKGEVVVIEGILTNGPTTYIPTWSKAKVPHISVTLPKRGYGVACHPSNVFLHKAEAVGAAVTKLRQQIKGLEAQISKLIEPS